MYIVAFFTNSGLPATGLNTPKIKIREIPSGTIIINNINMIEIDDGFYYYDFDLNEPVYFNPVPFTELDKDEEIEYKDSVKRPIIWL